MPVLSALAFADTAAVWRADALARTPGAVQPSGFALLDAQLPGGGWPEGALVELLQAPQQHQEWRLLLPALARLTQAQAGAVVLVGAPHVPFGPGLEGRGLALQRLLWVRTDQPLERLWATEQALRCADVLAVLAWLPQARADALRRLHLAAASHAKLLFVLRPTQAQAQASPAVLRLQLAPHAPDASLLAVQMLKRRGPPLVQPLLLPAGPLRLLSARGVGHALDRTAVAP